MAAERLGVPVGQLVAKDGVVSVASDSTKRVSYAELVGGRTFNLTLNPNAKRRSPADWTVLGKPVPRVEIPAMVTGRFEYVHNVRVPGMLHGRVVRPPLPTATLAERRQQIDAKECLAWSSVVVKKEFVGVVAEKPWQAIQAADRLKVTLDARRGVATAARSSRASARADADAGHTRGGLR